MQSKCIMRKFYPLHAPNRGKQGSGIFMPLAIGTFSLERGGSKPHAHSWCLRQPGLTGKTLKGRQPGANSSRLTLTSILISEISQPPVPKALRIVNYIETTCRKVARDQDGVGGMWKWAGSLQSVQRFLLGWKGRFCWWTPLFISGDCVSTEWPRMLSSCALGELKWWLW